MAAQTKHEAELCTLLVNDVFGELPSVSRRSPDSPRRTAVYRGLLYYPRPTDLTRPQRIFETLAQRGPCRLPQLFERTGLNPTQVRHGLAVLIQHDLLYYAVNRDTNATTYEANVTACGNVLRIGKIIDLIGVLYGKAEQEVVRHLFSLGHVQIADLAQAFGAQGVSVAEPNADSETADDKPQTNGDDAAEPVETGPAITSVFHLHEVIARLIQWDILQVVDAETFTNPEVLYTEIEQDYAKKATSVKSSKGKEDLAREKAAELRAARDRGKSLKRKLDSETPVPIPDAKRRKLANGHINGVPPTKRRRVLDVSLIQKSVQPTVLFTDRVDEI